MAKDKSAPETNLGSLGSQVGLGSLGSLGVPSGHILTGDLAAAAGVGMITMPDSLVTALGVSSSAGADSYDAMKASFDKMQAKEDALKVAAVQAQPDVALPVEPAKALIDPKSVIGFAVNTLVKMVLNIALNKIPFLGLQAKEALATWLTGKFEQLLEGGPEADATMLWFELDTAMAQIMQGQIPSAVRF